MSIVRKLRQLYAKVPDVGCKGLCVQSCGPVPLLDAERHNITVATGKDPGSMMAGEDLLCPQLKDGRCSIYADRPLLCRLYGALPEDGMRCQFGCEPTLTAEDGMDRLRELVRIRR
jgi:hypothetical protein